MTKLRNKLIVLSILLSSVVFYSFYDNYFEISKNLDIFTTLFKEVNQKYIDETDPGKLINAAIKGMMNELDPYTVFISEEQIEDVRFMTTGQYGGIGAIIQQRGEYVYIAEPYEGFPAFKAGLKAGDKILEIDGLSAKGKSNKEISSILKGQAGTNLQLTIARGNDTLEKALVREEVKIDNIPYSGMLNEQVGYIKLSGFMENAGKDVKEAFLKLKEENNLKGIVLDLRGNGGGLLSEAVNICNIFVPKGEEIVRTKGRMKEGVSIYATQNNITDKDIPLIVLVDQSSASASEIVSGAIQDLDRGIIIGQRTYGKGLVQNIFPLSYNTQAKVTIAKYYIPSGRCIQMLDYAHRNEDGSVGKIPDSLISEFTTKNGRKVYDGGGVTPDIKMEQGEYSEIAISLITKYLIFDFATQYTLTHQELEKPESFEVDDQLYQNFIDYISDKDYDYQTRSEIIMERFKEIAEEEKYFDQVTEEYKALQEKLIHNKKEDLIIHKEQIKSLLKNELVSRYYYQKGRIISRLNEDKEITKAIELINNTELYQSLLQPKADLENTIE